MNSVNLTAFAATTLSASASIASIVALSQTNSTPEKAAYAAGALFGLSSAIGSTTAWLRSSSTTSVQTYLSNAMSDTAVFSSGIMTSTAGALVQAAIEGAKQAIKETIYDALKPQKKPPVTVPILC